MQENAYFKLHDDTAVSILGYAIPAEWWSRVYEYPWAMQYAEPGLTVADMGAGWQQRPFKDMLAKVCGKVYAVDQHWEIRQLEAHDNMEFIVADFTGWIDTIPDASLDRVFCISVIEELSENMQDAMAEFSRCLKPGGKCIITADVVYDNSKPTPYCGGVIAEAMVDAASLYFSIGETDFDKTDAMHSELYNLCVFHCVGVKP